WWGNGPDGLSVHHGPVCVGTLQHLHKRPSGRRHLACRPNITTVEGLLAAATMLSHSEQLELL
ncbi:unnamed protein product, partial [Ectocarpus sp. 12 AP-2014]